MGKLRNQFRYSFRPGVVVLEGYITCVSGSPVTFTSAIKGVTSVTRTDTGDITLNLDQAYLDLVGFQACHHPVAGQATFFVVPQTLSAATRITEVGASTVKLTFQTEAGTPTDPAATDITWLQIALAKSAAVR